jgi:hypothetical protein
MSVIYQITGCPIQGNRSLRTFWHDSIRTHRISLCISGFPLQTTPKLLLVHYLMCLFPFEKRIVAQNKQNQSPWPLVRKPNIPTDRRHLSPNISANFCGWRVVAWLARRNPHGSYSSFLDRSRYFSFK